MEFPFEIPPSKRILPPGKSGRFDRAVSSVRAMLRSVQSRAGKDWPVFASHGRRVWGWPYVGGLCALLIGVGVFCVEGIQTLEGFFIARHAVTAAIVLFCLKLVVEGVKGTSWVGRLIVISLVAVLLGGLRWAAFKLIGQAEESQRAKDYQAARLEFLPHRTDRIQGIHFDVRLNRAYYPNELEPFRMLMQATISVNPWVEIWMASYGPAKIRAAYNGKEISESQNVAWIVRDQTHTVLVNQTLGWDHSNTSRLKSTLFPRNDALPLRTIESLDGVFFQFWVSKQLFPKIRYITVWANEYVFLALPLRCIDTIDSERPVWPDTMPSDLQEQWSKEDWLRLVPRGFRPNGPAPPIIGTTDQQGHPATPVFQLSFVDSTPVLGSSTRDNSGVAIPNYNFCGER